MTLTKLAPLGVVSNRRLKVTCVTSGCVKSLWDVGIDVLLLLFLYRSLTSDAGTGFTGSDLGDKSSLGDG